MIWIRGISRDGRDGRLRNKGIEMGWLVVCLAFVGVGLDRLVHYQIDLGLQKFRALFISINFLSSSLGLGLSATGRNLGAS